MKLFLIQICVSVLFMAYAQEGSAGGQQADTPPPPPPKQPEGDGIYIECGVCNQLAQKSTSAYKLHKALNSKITKDQLAVAINDICNADSKIGLWINGIDLVEKEDKLLVVDMKQSGVCGDECKIVAKTCQFILDDVKPDLVDALYTHGLTGDKLQTWLCTQKTNACTKTIPPVPSTRTPGPEFQKGPPVQRDMNEMIELATAHANLAADTIKEQVTVQLERVKKSATYKQALDMWKKLQEKVQKMQQGTKEEL